jgi:membrane protease subunit HflK
MPYNGLDVVAPFLSCCASLRRERGVVMSEWEFYEPSREEPSGPKHRIPRMFQSGKMVTLLLFVLLAGVAAYSSYYIVPAGTRGVVFRLGKVHTVADQGLHFKVPFLDSVIQVNTERIRRYEFGYRTVNVGPPAQYRDVPAESKMLTSDNKIVEIDWVLQFQISDPAVFVVHVPSGEDRWEKLVRDLGESSLRKIVASRDLDTVLTVGKEEIQTETRVAFQKLLEELETGIRIVAVQLQDVTPPVAVQASFSEVNSARAEKERLQLEAEQFANELIPQAQGEAQRLLNESEGYKFRRVQVAQGEAARIEALREAYMRNPNLLLQSLWIENMRELWPKLKTVIVEDFGNGVMLFPLDKLLDTGRGGEGR